MQCLICGKDTEKGICHKCRGRLPFDYPCSGKSPMEILTEFKRNERLKSKFQCSTKLGTIECDMLNGIIKIKNAYHSIREIKSCTFYAGEPRFSGLWRRDIYENVWFTYQLRNGIRPKEQKIQTAICHFRTDSQNYYIEPPVCVTVYKQIINGMVEDMQRKLRLLGAATITEEILDDSKDNTTGNTDDEL